MILRALGCKKKKGRTGQAGWRLAERDGGIYHGDWHWQGSDRRSHNRQGGGGGERLEEAEERMNEKTNKNKEYVRQQNKQGSADGESERETVFTMLLKWLDPCTCHNCVRITRLSSHSLMRTDAWLCSIFNRLLWCRGILSSFHIGCENSTPAI